jgi:cytosine deaminase
VLINAENVPDALVRAPARAVVIAGGRVVARDGALV